MLLRPLFVAALFLSASQSHAAAPEPDPTAVSPQTLDNITELVRQRGTPDAVISHINATPGNYIFGGKAEERLRVAVAGSWPADYAEITDRIVGAMFAKMKQTPEMAKAESALPIRVSGVDPYSSYMAPGASPTSVPISEFRDLKNVFIWSNNVMARDKLLQALAKDGRFNPIYDAQKADYIIQLDFDHRNVSRQTDSGGTYDLCYGDVCSTESYGPSFATMRLRAAKLMVYRYVHKTGDTGKCSSPDAMACKYTRGMEYNQLIGYSGYSAKQGAMVGRKHPIDTLIADFLKKF
jgi:hypothetical protein